MAASSSALASARCFLSTQRPASSACLALSAVASPFRSPWDAVRRVQLRHYGEAPATSRETNPWVDRRLEQQKDLASRGGREYMNVFGNQERSQQIAEVSYGDNRLGMLDQEQRQILWRMKDHMLANEPQKALDLYATVAEPDPRLQDSALRACVKMQDATGASHMFRSISNPTIFSYNTMIQFLGRLRRTRDIESLWSEMMERGVKPSHITYTHMMFAYGLVYESQKVAQLLNEMEAAGLTITEVEFGAALGAYGKSGAKEMAAELIQRMDASGVQAHLGHLTSWIVSHSASKDEAGAQKAFDDVLRRGLKPDVVCYTAFVSCMSGPGFFQRIQEVKGRMEAEGLTPHGYFYNQILRAALEDGEAGTFEAVLAEMEAKGIEQNRSTRSTIARQQAAVHQKMLDQPISEWNAASASAASTSTAAPPEAPPAAEAPLPPGWAQATDPASGKSYYWKTADPASTTTWDRPVA
eukprot:TRINITY_DN7450_c0_g1_i1.p1 TRINITY_DN7450_c0_g1~~TRINITY_DN7450_c0_g1_i1.p1  ORF type:complete len:470 (-),score=93.21 TRINITY_DN7450_c0_g1_i1:257-1666(-)